jgi:hypothetical protein
VNDSRPWWLWPNLLALDAPAVAVTWQVFLGHVAGVAVPPAASAVLALVVWAAYLLDRSLDARSGADLTDRHRVAGRYWLAWVVAAAAAVACAAAVAFAALPQEHVRVGFVVLGAAVGYLAAVHLLRAKNVLDRGAKEVSVGVVFAAGVAIPLVVHAVPHANWLPGVVAFAALCWLNCTLISVWESHGRSAPVRAPPAWVAALAGAVAVAVALDSPLLVAVAVCASTAALAALHAVHARVSLRASRVLADFVLLSPIVVVACRLP